MTAQLDAANAHCTISQRETSSLRLQLDNQKKKTRPSVKIKARFVTLPEMKEAFEAEEKLHLGREKEKAEKIAEKTASEAARTTRIQADVLSKTFDGPISTYKLKIDLMTIAGAFGLSAEGRWPS